MTKTKTNLAAFITLTFLITSNVDGISQTSVIASEKQVSAPLTIEEKLKTLEGTIQILVKDLRYKPNIPYNIDEIVAKNRKQNDIVYISLGTAVRLKIFPTSHVKSEKQIELISTY